MGPEGVKACLNAGANDLGGTLMDETITRSAGATHGTEMTPGAMESIIRSIGREPRQRDTLYRDTPADRYRASFVARAAGAARPLEHSPEMVSEMVSIAGGGGGRS
jgi:FO synthase